MTTVLGIPVSQKVVLAAATPQIIGGSESGRLVMTVATGTTVNKLEVTTATQDDIQAGAAVWVTEGATFVGPAIYTLANRVTAARLTSTAGGNAYILREK